jgi:hypothetical protein
MVNEKGDLLNQQSPFSVASHRSDSLRSACLPPFSDLIAYHGSGCGATDSTECAAENCVAGYAANDSAGAGSNLRIGGAGAATAQSDQAGDRGRNQDFCFHGLYLHI